MVISSDTLFHFTKSIEDLLYIFENGFVARYCLEDLSGLFGEGDRWQRAFPMACFCDLPLSQLGEHLNLYGSYGIGMNKEWGIAHGINPVLYLHAQSDLARVIKREVNDWPGWDKSGSVAAFLELTSHIKPYDGHIHRGDGRVYRRFYDEKEWRWVPSPALWDQPEHYVLTREEFINPERKEAADRSLANIAKLTFTPEDVKYIIVATEIEKLQVIKDIEAINRIKEPDTVKLMASRLISAEQINTDF